MATMTTTNGATAANHAADVAGRDHVVIFPFMAKGHTLPLLHFATALSAHHKSLRVTLLTTPANRAFAASRMPSSVRLVELPFPSLPPLPAGVESTDALPCPSLYPAFLRATALLRGPFAEFLASLPSPPLALVSDFFLGFTHRAANDAGVRRVVFHGMSCFSMATCKALIVSQAAASAEPGGAPFHVPGMPEHVAITADEVPDAVVKFGDTEDPVTRFLIDDVGFSDVLSWGILVNSFAALDEDYVAPFKSFYQPGARAWLAGPLFLAPGDMSELEEEAEKDAEGCLAWLDERVAQPESVVYVSFGTQAHISDAQLDEIAHGLVQSGHRFLWVVRSDTWSPPVNVGPNGRIVRGWVPQRRILAHKAVGGFVSHCGWNSVMESLAAGKPILAWPMIAEQHLNARHVADIVGAGVRIHTKPGGMAAIDVVGRAEVEEKVRMLMDADSEGAKKIRARATWVQQAAKSAVSEGGGSRVALQKLVDELQRAYGDIVDEGKM
ncbi:UDP-glycosyltransferase 90A2 [Dichanthelium oligosanthes]|uniref:Glycosyltransferase n=1 Tax=Dichanthelium oligosanthes TaxID=888268 RepID=A0A1E5UTZ1_9POAL|nr:UDP-glycosyltransferase 90A2 [Dichanthelium oligosanthes]